MPSGDHAEGKAGQRARATTRSGDIAAAGGPAPKPPFKPGLDWYAANLLPRDWDEIEDQVVLIGTVESLVGSASFSGGGMTVQLQILPAYAHVAVDMIQRATQGVLVARLYQAPWELFKTDGPAWDHLNGDSDE